VTSGLIGALEEIFISRVDTSLWTRFNWNVPPTGITDFYIWDYTVPSVREFWAESLATLYNNLTYGTVGAGQWDGAGETLPSFFLLVFYYRGGLGVLSVRLALSTCACVMFTRSAAALSCACALLCV
jgi:hypothetical protein